METREAFEVVLKMAHGSYSKNFGPNDNEREALEIAEDYMEYWRGKVEHAKYRDERPSTGCDYGIGG